MPLFDLGCRLSYDVAAPTAFVFNIEPAEYGAQRILEEHLTLEPDPGPATRFVPVGSGSRLVRWTVQPGPFRVEYRARVEVTPALLPPHTITELPAGELPLDVLPFTTASRYCESDRLARFAQREFGHQPLGYQRVTAICNWIYDNVDYLAGTSDALTSAFDTVTQRAGVCRDFAHLGIALTRALGIPARYVSAYAWRLDPPDFHAVFEAFLAGEDGGAWFLFDPTRRSAPDGLVRIGVGRDAADAAFATIFGQASGPPPEVWIEGPPTEANVTTQAVSTLSA